MGAKLSGEVRSFEEGDEVHLYCFVFLFSYGCVLFIQYLKEVYGVNFIFG